MTSDNPTPTREAQLLDDILHTVRSIDRNVEDILDRLEGHFDDMRYDRHWRNHGYDLRSADDLDEHS